MRDDVGEELIEQRTAQQADDMLMKGQAVGADGAPVFALPGQFGGLQRFEHPVGLIVAQRATGTDGLQFQRAPNLEQVPHLINIQTTNHHTFIAHIAGQAFLPKPVQGFTNGIARRVVGRHQIVFHQRHAGQQTTTDDVGTQLQCDVVGQ
ncbi:hypothetical protein D3C76_1327180 [compost metagenome]